MPAHLSTRHLPELTLPTSHLLHDNAVPHKIRISATLQDSKDSKDLEDSKHPQTTCHVPQSLLANVSPKLVDTCSRGLLLEHVGEEVIRMFVSWLLYQKLDVDESDEENAQTRLAQAWNFGAEYEMPTFQNKVMRKLVELINTQRIDPEAVVEAYRPRERGSLLQKAFVQQLASDMAENAEGVVWTRVDFMGCSLGTDSQFLLDLQLSDTLGDGEYYLDSAGDA